MNVIKIIALISMATAMAGCATTAKFRVMMNSWIGAPAERLINSWGYPASQMTAPDGNVVYIYNRQGSISLPSTTYTNATITGYGNSAYGSAYTTTYGGGVIHMSCTTYFEVGQDQRIVAWHAQGNACKSR